MTKQVFSIIISFVISVSMLVVVLIHTSATETTRNDRVNIDNSGKITFISDHGEKDGINSLQFSLKVKAKTDADVSFEFENISGAKVTDYRYHADENYLNIYIAGTEPLFKGTDSIVLGSVKVKDSSGKDVKADISAVEGSLKYVKSNHKLMNDDIGDNINTQPTDPNGDDEFNIRDAAYVAKMIAQGKTKELHPSADYNGDGIINIRDAAAMARDIASGKLQVD